MSYTRLTRDFYQAVESLMEGKIEEKLDPQASEGGGSEPKTDKHKKLAAMGHPKDKITHKDVLIARGVVAKEEAEIEEEAELEEGKETEQMMVKSFKPEVVKALDKRGVTKHAPYRNPGLEKLAAQKKAMKEDAEELQENISNNHKVGDVYQMDLVDHIKKKTGTKVYFDGDDMVHEKTGKTIMNIKAHHTVGDAISAVKKVGKGVTEEFEEQLDEISQKLATAAYAKRSGTMTHDDPVARKKEDKAWERIGKRWGQKGQQKADAAADKYQAEEAEEEVDQVITENNSFEIEIPAQLTYKDYLDAAMKFVDEADAVTVAEAFYNEQDESLVIEAFTRSDIEQKVKVHQNAGNQVTMPKFGTKDGKPYAEYVVTNKDDGIRRKYIHHGTMRRVENMGAKGKKDAD